MQRFGDKCKRCKKGLTVWIGVLIGGTQLYECPDCGNIQSGLDLQKQKEKKP